MRSRQGRDDWNHLMEDLETLQRTWEGKTASLVQLGRGLWAHGVVFGIETGRNSMAEQKASSVGKLNALLNGWETIANLKVSGPAAESIQGIDFGIHLVIRRVDQYLNRMAQPKPPTKDDGGKAPLGYKRGPRAQS